MIEPKTRYGHFEVLEFDHREGKLGKNGQMRYRYFYKCLCDCGNKFVTREDGIKRQKKKKEERKIKYANI